jgi:hypothetical protein
MGDKSVTKSSKKVASFFSCIPCAYNTNRKCNYDKHLLTAKHIEVTLGDKKVAKSSTKNINHICCECGKIYESRNGLWKHSKSCVKPQPNISINYEQIQQNTTEQMKLFTEAIKTTVIEVMKNGPTINTNNNNNNNNKTFNLNLYLNETCKDAINIEDFVKSIKVQIEDLEYTGRQGYVDGITNIILNNLHSIHVHQRPIHCTDEKREILYIKNEGEWIKEADNKPVLTNAIKTIANENIKQINEWTKLYPDCKEADSKKNNLYLKIVSNSMSGGTKDECCKNYNKIIRNIVRDTTIDKDDCVP